MSYVVTTEDKRIALSRWQSVLLKIQVLNDDETVLDEFNNVIDYGGLDIDTSSYKRRTYHFTIVPIDQSINISEHSRIWLNKKTKLFVLIKTPRDNEYFEYEVGTFIFTDTSSNFDISTNSMTINCSDTMSLLDGTQNGQLGELTTIIPAYEEDSSGNPVKYNVIRDALISVITQLGKVKQYLVDDIGELNGLERYNENYATYRTSHPQWNCIPYDLEFSTGTFVSEIIEQIIELYPNYDASFNRRGVFVAQMIPSCIDDPVVMTNEEIKSVFISEQSSTTFTSVRNIVHVWGQVFEPDYYSQSVTNSSSVYSVSIDGYTSSYANGDRIGLLIPSTNANIQYININGIGNIQLYDENTDSPLSGGSLLAGTSYVFKIRRNYVNGAFVEKAYLQGQWQAHGLSALVDGSTGESYTCSDGTVTTKYSKKYFQDVYNVDSVCLKIVPNSPFTVQKIGERLDTKSDGDYANITSDSLAIERANYELYLDARLTDNITIVVGTIIPWLEEYMKISYIKENTEEEKQYIVQKISLDFNSGTTTITMSTFYPLYEE